ncbi:MAG: class I SAM-dependent methyltransferase [Planctomycetota bacterium]|nr:class I SAM-dependent methyltransferase [Planctomycetota bacterium]
MPRPRRVEKLDACPLCGSRWLLVAPVQPEPPFGLSQCSACGIIFLSPRPPLDAMKTYYDAMYDREDHPHPRQQQRALRHLRRLSRYAPTPGRLLDVGAGDGYFLNAARTAGWQVEGLELAEPRVARARTWFNLSLRSCDILAAPFPPATFDAVTMLQLLEHLHDPRAVLARVHELLRPGGIMLLSTPNVLAYARKHRDVNSWRIHLVARKK